MSTEAGFKLRVAICGGGIGGLTLACALSRAKGLAVDVYERAPDFNTEIGAGISIRPRNMPFLSGLGLAEEIAAINGRTGGASGSLFTVYKADTPELKVLREVREEGSVSVHRAEFHNILSRHIPEHVGMHSNKRLASYVDPEGTGSPICLTFTDGSTATCDVLVGADGVKSAVRAKMLEDVASRMEDQAQAEKLREAIPPRFSGAITYRAIIPKETLSHIAEDSSVWTSGNNYTGSGRAVVSYPISQGRLLNAALTTFDFSLEDTLHPQPWVAQAQGKDLVPLLEGWAEEPRSIIAGLDGLDTKKWVINIVRPLDNWSIGRVTLLGDAAHAMPPFQGAGAGQAIEDAQVLSALLAHPSITRETVHQALRVYSDVRLPVAMAIFNASRRSGQLMGESKMLPEEIVAEFARVGQSAWKRGSPEEDVKRAVELFEKAVTE